MRKIRLFNGYNFERVGQHYGKKSQERAKEDGKQLRKKHGLRRKYRVVPTPQGHDLYAQK